MSDVVVIGAGLAGLAATVRLQEQGREVTLVTKGIGGLQLGQGTVDVLGYSPELVTEPLAAVDAYRAERRLVAISPAGPYTKPGGHRQSCAGTEGERSRGFFVTPIA